MSFSPLLQPSPILPLSTLEESEKPRAATSARETETGTVKHFSPDRRYGFIKSVLYGDCFFHIKDMHHQVIAVGDQVSFVPVVEMHHGTRKFVAKEVKSTRPPPSSAALAQRSIELGLQCAIVDANRALENPAEVTSVLAHQIQLLEHISTLMQQL